MVSVLFIALLITILVEATVAIVLGYRKKLEIATIILINIITNPLLNYLLFMTNYLGIIRVNTIGVLFLELIIVLVEWLLLRFVLQQDPKKLFVLSLAMNLCSYLAGVLIFR
jgi:hypothetical protein